MKLLQAAPDVVRSRYNFAVVGYILVILLVGANLITPL